MQSQGHKVTIVLGTFTAQLGDPSGRDTTRPILSAEETSNNSLLILDQVKKIITPDFLFFNGTVHNHMRLPEFLRIASRFTLSHMTSRNGFQQRIENGNSIALHELLVPICQGWDSVHLKSEIEVGGQDQLFNFQIARQLQEQEGQKPQSCVMLPIINGTDGRKMSKSLGNCIFLDDEPTEIFGKVMSISDAVMDEWFPLLTDMKPATHPMNSKKILARDIVSQLHGPDIAETAASHFEKTIQRKEVPDDVKPIKSRTLIEAVCELRNCSKSEARRLVAAGAVDAPEQLAEGCIIRVGRQFGKIT
jgi:tyrosyl-tRNA synthetase